jgi:hypothetical protein
MSLVEGDQPVQAVSPYRADHTLNALTCCVRTGIFRTRTPIDATARSRRAHDRTATRASPYIACAVIATIGR